MVELFYIKIHMMQIKVDCLFDPGSQSNLIFAQLVDNLEMETQYHPHFVDEVFVDVVPLHICGVILGSPYLYMRGAIFRRRANCYRLFKDGKSYAINAHQDKANLSLINSHRERRIMGNTKKFVLLFLRERKNHAKGSKLDMKESLEGCSGK
jgi:hypothetical protein